MHPIQSGLIQPDQQPLLPDHDRARDLAQRVSNVSYKIPILIYVVGAAAAVGLFFALGGLNINPVHLPLVALPLALSGLAHAIYHYKIRSQPEPAQLAAEEPPALPSEPTSPPLAAPALDAEPVAPLAAPEPVVASVAPLAGANPAPAVLNSIPNAHFYCQVAQMVEKGDLTEKEGGSLLHEMRELRGSAKLGESFVYRAAQKLLKLYSNDAHPGFRTLYEAAIIQEGEDLELFSRFREWIKSAQFGPDLVRFATDQLQVARAEIDKNTAVVFFDKLKEELLFSLQLMFNNLELNEEQYQDAYAEIYTIQRAPGAEIYGAYQLLSHFQNTALDSQRTNVFKPVYKELVTMLPNDQLTYNNQLTDEEREWLISVLKAVNRVALLNDRTTYGQRLLEARNQGMQSIALRRQIDERIKQTPYTGLEKESIYKQLEKLDAIAPKIDPETYRKRLKETYESGVCSIELRKEVELLNEQGLLDEYEVDWLLEVLGGVNKTDALGNPKPYAQRLREAYQKGMDILKEKKAKAASS